MGCCLRPRLGEFNTQDQDLAKADSKANAAKTAPANTAWVFATIALSGGMLSSFLLSAPFSPACSASYTSLAIWPCALGRCSRLGYLLTKLRRCVSAACSLAAFYASYSAWPTTRMAIVDDFGNFPLS